MTAGHPDFQQYASWRGAPIVSNPAAGLGPGGNNYGITPIPHYSSLTVRVYNGNRNVTAGVIFYADAGGVTTVQTMQFIIPVGGTLSANVPALGPFVQFSVGNLGAAGGAVGLFVQPTNIPAPAPVYISNASGAPLAWGSASLAASASLTITTAEVYAGLVSFFGSTSSGTQWHGTANYYDDGALAFQLIGEINTDKSQQRRQLLTAAPASIINLGASNDDSVTRTITLAIMRAG